MHTFKHASLRKITKSKENKGTLFQLQLLAGLLGG